MATGTEAIWSHAVASEQRPWELEEAESGSPYTRGCVLTPALLSLSSGAPLYRDLFYRDLVFAAVTGASGMIRPLMWAKHFKQ